MPLSDKDNLLLFKTNTLWQYGESVLYIMLENIKEISVKPHVIAITEVKYKNTSSFSVSELSLDGFDLYSNDLEKKSERSANIC